MNITEMAAKRVGDSDGSLGWVLSRYEAAEGKNHVQVASELKMALDDYLWLWFCLRPRHDNFLNDVREIEVRHQIPPGILAGIVRTVESLEAMRSSNSVQDGFVAAARARKVKRKPKAPKGRNKK